MTIVLSNGNAASSVVTYTCDGSGGAPSDGDATRTCQGDGSWSGAAPTSCFIFAAQYEDVTNDITLYLTQPVACPLTNNVAANGAALLTFYEEQCALGGKRAVGCNGGHYDSSNAASINAVRMPVSYGCNMRTAISTATGWANHYAICCANSVIYGTSGAGDRHASLGDFVQLVQCMLRLAST